MRALRRLGFVSALMVSACQVSGPSSSAKGAELDAKSEGALTAAARRVEPGAHSTTEAVWYTGSTLRQVLPFDDIWISADVAQNYDFERIVKSKRRETVHYRPSVGAPFEVVEEHEYAAPPRHVECALQGHPEERILGTIIDSRSNRGPHVWGKVIADVDNRGRWILPGTVLAMAVQTDREPVLLLGTAELPRDAVIGPATNATVDP
jgi:hypothetical protein